MFSSLKFAWNSVFVLELWKIHFSFLNFQEICFYTWISSFWKKNSRTKSMCINKLFQNSGTKKELHAKFRDENNSLIFSFVIFFISKSRNTYWCINIGWVHCKFWKYSIWNQNSTRNIKNKFMKIFHIYETILYKLTIFYVESSFNKENCKLYFWKYFYVELTIYIDSILYKKITFTWIKILKYFM